MAWFPDVSFKKLFTARIIIVIAIISMIALSYLSFSRINRLNELSDWVNHSNIVIVKLQTTYSDLSDADSELNKFIITHDSVYLSNMYAFENQIQTSLADLKSLTVDNPFQQKRVLSLDSLMSKRFRLMDVVLKGPVSQYERIVSEISSLNSVTKRHISILKSEENKLLVEREKSAAQYKSWTPFVIFTIETAVVAFLFMAYSHVAKELKIKAKLQRELERQKNEVERQMLFNRAILDNSVDAILVFDRSLNILSANKAAINVFKIPSHAIGRSMFEEYPKSQGSTAHKAILKALEGESVHIPNLPSQVVDRVYESFFIPLPEGNEVHAALAIHHDITDLVKASREIEKRNEELNISNKQLEQFAYITSHDLQEPIRKIQTFTNLAARHKGDIAKVDSYLTKIDNSASRMGNLVRDILNYSRLSSNADSKEDVDLNQIVEQVIQDFELLIHEKSAVIKVENLPVISGSRHQMLQLFGNLMSNSLKFSDTAPNIVIHSETKDNHHVIYFADNGIGFEQKYDSHIFEVFKRLHGPSAYSGTGIGLSICKRIVDNHQGAIHVKSELGRGTTFAISLPVKSVLNGTEKSLNGSHEKIASNKVTEILKIS